MQVLSRDWSVSAITAGFLAVLIAYAGPAVIFFQAAAVAGISNEMLSSWIWAISIGPAITGIYLSWKFKTPIVTAWSAPGTALLVTLFPAISVNQAVAAYITAAVIMFVIGVSGWFDRIIRAIPRGIASGMMAGILFQFGLDAFRSAATMPLLAFGMIGAYIVFRRLWPRYCIVLVLLAGIALAVLTGHTNLGTLELRWATPVFIMPDWTWDSTLSLALPLVLVSLTGQFLPGMAILKVSGYETPARPLLVTTSMASVVVAVFGGINVVIAAITAALCTGKDAHEDPGKRYVAGIANGVFYLIGGLFAGTIVLLFTALPKEFIAVLAGLALVGAIASNVVGTVQDEENREAAIITFLATASNMSYLGLGSAFWGVVIGGFAYAVLRLRKAKA
ncbi:benzoate/H(+) symporter BenE family transporter [Pusillimonas caeni]|uniref:benzoate/H(+) symporter BenE family transporter n=1 Tax=Pusillimonas caeni TaxID=1348472 RepID=UPI000E59D75A|nr:benzoate/H(+) symporter BenE family transporter [Pusillimonas caeni]